MRKTRFAVGGIAFLSLLWAPASSTRADDDEALLLLLKVQTLYGKLQTYADHGTITIDARIGDEQTTETVNFVTAFDAPNEMRYDQWYTTPTGELQEVVLWLDDGEAKIWRTQPVYSDEPQVIEEASRDEAFMQAARGSGGQDNFVPRFLLSYGSSSLIFNLENIRIEGEMELDGVECWFLSGKFVNTARLRLVVGKEDLLIRRAVFIVRPEDHIVNNKLGEAADGGVVRAGGLKRGVIKTTVDYHPRTDVYFQREDLTFDPEADAERPGEFEAISASGDSSS